MTTRVLVVDDEPALLEILAETLTADGYEVALARDGVAALAQVHRWKPDLVLTDMHMPGMSGLELLRKLRGDLSTAGIPVVFLTVVENVDTEAQALNLGADDYLTKPVQKSRLLGRIRRSLVRARLSPGSA